MTDATSGLLIWPVVLPLAGGAGLFCLRHRTVPALGVGISAGVVVSVLRVIRAVLTQGVQRHALGGWEAPLGITLRVDGLSATMLGLSALVGFVLSLYSVFYFSGDAARTRRHRFWPLWMFLWGGLNALFLSHDVFNLYVTLEVVSLASIPLIALAGSREAVKAALHYLLLAVLGSMSFIFGVSMLYARFGVLDIGLLSAAMVPGTAAQVALTLMLVGLMVKGALFPMHVWLPPAHGSAPTPVSAALSGLVVTASFYIMARLWFYVFAALELKALSHLLGLCGCCAIFWGGVQALRQTRLKMLVAYSTVSQIGYLFLLFPLTQASAQGAGIAWAGGMLFAVSHGIAKSAAFLAAGTFLKVLGNDRIDTLKGVAHGMPILAFAFAIAGINLMGLPPSGGFIAKWLLLKAAFLTQQWWYGLAIVGGGLLAFCYIFRVLEAFMATPPPSAAAEIVREPRRMSVLVLLLALAAAALAFATAVPLDILGVDAPVTVASFAPEDMLP